ncbi:MAG: spoIIIJ-associated protein [Hyphomicrobiaceae bacterium]|jgi:spoIIIJ-associated protein
MPSSIEAQGATVDEAIQIVLNKLGTSRDKVEIVIVHHPRRGFLGIGARRAKVRATVREGVMVDGEEFDMSRGAGDSSQRQRQGNRRGRDGRDGRSGGGEQRSSGRGRGDRSKGPNSGAAASASGTATGSGSGSAAADGDRGGQRGRNDGRQARDGADNSRSRNDRNDRKDRRDGNQANRNEGRGDASKAAKEQPRQSGRPEPKAKDTRPDARSGNSAAPQEAVAGEEGRGRGRRRGGRGRGGRGQKNEVETTASVTEASTEERNGNVAERDKAADGNTRGPETKTDSRPVSESDAAQTPPVEATPRVDSRQPLAETAAELVPAEPPREEKPIDLDALAETAARLAGEMLTQMGFEAEISSRVDAEEGEAIIQARCDAEGLLIGRRGQTLDALEHILNRMSVRVDGGGEARVLLDIGEYRERRRESLSELADRLKQRAIAEGRNVQVSPMSPRDRKFFQAALAGDEMVEARSLGAGFYRRVVVVPRNPVGPDSAEAERPVAQDVVQDNQES